MLAIGQLKEPSERGGSGLQRVHEVVAQRFLAADLREQAGFGRRREFGQLV